MSERAADPDAPVVLLGRGGGGTRLLSELARSGGLHLGGEISASGDSLDWVEPIYAAALEEVAAGLPLDAGAAARAGPLRQRARQATAEPAPRDAAGWGWKLPETLLALWPVLHAFPGARVVHLVRHPLTLALRRSHMTSRLDNPIGRAVLPAAYLRIGRDPDRIAHDPVWLRNAASWIYQVSHVLDCRAARPATPWLQLSYESLLADPASEAAALAAFIGSDRLGRLAVDAERGGAAVVFGESSEAVWAICAGTAERLGYRYDQPLQPPSTPA